jgi:hypothetical protein
MNLISIINGIVSALLPTQKATEEITSEELRALLEIYSTPDADIFLSDSMFKLADIETLSRFLAWNQIDKKQYKKTVYDCDDFAESLKGDVRDWDSHLAFGTAWIHRESGNHALNITVTKKKELVFVEPQTDEMTRVSGKQIYYVVF